MEFTLDRREGAFELAIIGELDAISAPTLRSVIGTIGEDRPSKVIVDLSRLRLIDSSGVGALVALFKMVKAYRGSMAVVGAHDQPLAIFRLLQLDRVLTQDGA
jgi:anti-sigma B factor antagonist